MRGVTLLTSRSTRPTRLASAVSLGCSMSFDSFTLTWHISHQCPPPIAGTHEFRTCSSRQRLRHLLINTRLHGAHAPPCTHATPLRRQPHPFSTALRSSPFHLSTRATPSLVAHLPPNVRKCRADLAKLLLEAHLPHGTRRRPADQHWRLSRLSALPTRRTGMPRAGAAGRLVAGRVDPPATGAPQQLAMRRCRATPHRMHTWTRRMRVQRPRRPPPCRHAAHTTAAHRRMQSWPWRHSARHSHTATASHRAPSMALSTRVPTSHGC